MLAKNRINSNKIIIRLNLIAKTLILHHLYKMILMDMSSGKDSNKYVSADKALKIWIYEYRNLL